MDSHLDSSSVSATTSDTSEEQQKKLPREQGSAKKNLQQAILNGKSGRAIFAHVEVDGIGLH